jgi:hypothetical protein
MAINSGFLSKTGCSNQQNREFHDEDTPKSMFFWGNFWQFCIMTMFDGTTWKIKRKWLEMPGVKQQ